MDVIIISNGLGNQLSQFAFFLNKKRLGKSTAFLPFCYDHNGFELEYIFGIGGSRCLRSKVLYLIFRLMITERFGPLGSLLKKMLLQLGVRIVNENFDYSFKEKYLNPSKGLTFYYGGWHCPYYFIDVDLDIKRILKFPVPTDLLNLEYEFNIKNSNSVSLHVRRGDYLSDSNKNLFGDICTDAYFVNAISYIEKHVVKPHFFVFSNDLDWAKQNIRAKNITFISGNSGFQSWKDMYLMSLCRHNIIANSTFSWWGAWLNQNHDCIIVCPDRFTATETETEVYPRSWVRINATAI